MNGDALAEHLGQKPPHESSTRKLVLRPRKTRWSLVVALFISFMCGWIGGHSTARQPVHHHYNTFNVQVIEKKMATYNTNDAGTVAFRGNYPETGTFNSRPYFQLDSGHFLLVTKFATLGPNSYGWALRTTLSDSSTPSDTSYYVAVAQLADITATPPLTGWNVGSSGGAVGPAPTFTIVAAQTVALTARYWPRTDWPQRMTNGVFQGSDDGVNYTNLATITSQPPVNQYSTISLGSTMYRYFRYLAPSGSYGNVVELEFLNNGVKLTGTYFGTAGSYNNNANLVFSKAFDGNTSTFFDSATANGNFLGLDTVGNGVVSPKTNFMPFF